MRISLFADERDEEKHTRQIIFQWVMKKLCSVSLADSVNLSYDIAEVVLTQAHMVPQ